MLLLRVCSFRRNMSIKVNITGMKTAQKNLSEYVSKKTKQLRDEANKAAINVARGAKRDVNVDTGRLRASIHEVFANSTDPDTGVSTGDTDSAVVTNVEYAPWQELIKPYMFPNWEAERPEYIRRVSKVLGKLR